MALFAGRRHRKPKLKVVSSRAEPDDTATAAARAPSMAPRPTLIASTDDPLAVDMKAAERTAHDAAERREEDRKRLKANLLAAFWVVLLVAGAVWLIESALDNARLQDCYARGGRNCVKLDIPPAR